MSTESPITTTTPRAARARRLAGGWIVGAAVLAAIVLLVIFWDWNWFRPLVEKEISAELGRPVTLQHFDLKPGRQTVAIADGVAIADPAGYPGGANFATIGRLTIALDAMAYIHGRHIVVPSIVVDRPVVNAEQPAGKPANWDFPALAPSPDKPAAPAPDIGDLQINDGSAHVLIPNLRTDFQMHIQTSGDETATDATATTTGASFNRKINVDAKGTYGGQPITGAAIGGALLSLRDAQHPYPIDLHIENGPTRVSLVGTVQNPMAFAGANLKLRLEGPDMSLLLPLAGIALPKTPPYQIAGNLDYRNGQIRFEHFAGKMGSSDLEGDIAVEPRKPRMLVTANVESRVIDLADLGGFIGSQPGRLSTPNQTPEQKAELARAEASPQVLPTKPIDLPSLRMADIHLRYSGAKILGRAMPFDTFAVVMDIDDGRIRLTPVTLGVGRGKIDGNIDLEPLSDKQIKLHGDIGVDHVDVGRMLKATGFVHGSGTLGGHAVLDSTGNSVATFAGNGNGSLRLAMAGGGNVSALIVDLSGFELGNALLSALGLPNREQIECFVGDFGLEHGVLSTRSLVLSTDANIMAGTGSIDFRNETIDYHLKTESKHFSIGTLPTPIAISGTFRSPAIKPEILPLGVRGGAAVGLGFLFPPAALLPLVQFGVGDDPNCAPLAHRSATLMK